VAHPLALARAQIDADSVGKRQHFRNDSAQLGASVGVDPAPLARYDALIPA